MLVLPDSVKREISQGPRNRLLPALPPISAAIGNRARDARVCQERLCNRCDLTLARFGGRLVLGATPRGRSRQWRARRSTTRAPVRCRRAGDGFGSATWGRSPSDVIAWRRISALAAIAGLRPVATDITGAGLADAQVESRKSPATPECALFCAHCPLELANLS